MSSERVFITAGDVSALLGFHSAYGFQSRREMLEARGFPARISWCDRPFKWRRKAVEDWITASEALDAAIAEGGEFNAENVVMMAKARVA